MAEGFNAFWIMYPRKVAKKAAEKAYVKALKLYPHAAIMASLGIFLETEWRGRELDKIPHAASWLNRESFEEHEERTELAFDEEPESPPDSTATHKHWCNGYLNGHQHLSHDWQCYDSPCLWPGHYLCPSLIAKREPIEKVHARGSQI